MHKLAMRLPPFSPDYSGVCSALFELGGMLVIHDAAGCTGNYTGYDEPRWYGYRSLVFCSALREADAVLGNEDKFIKEIQAAALDLRPAFICLLGSPVPMLIGSDFTGIAREVEILTGIPSIGFATTGLQYYDKGAAKAFLALAKQFVTQVFPKSPHTVNLLGATPLDFAAGSNLEDFRAEFEARGFEVLSVFAMGSSMEQLRWSSAASVNIVLSACGLELAQYFYRVFGTPYVIGQPMGRASADRLCALAEEAAATGENRVYRCPENDDARILLIGEQVTMHSLRACLHADFGVAGVDIGCPFSMTQELAASGDVSLPTERAIKDVMNNGRYTRIIADPLFKALLKADGGGRFVSLPHVAVSSKVYWHNPAELAGKKIKKYIEERVLQ